MKRVFFAVAALFVMAACCEVENLPMENTKWNLTELQGATNEAFADADTFWFALDGEGIIGVGACNRFFGGYMLSEEEGFRVGGMGMTRMACHNMELEDQFVRIFEDMDGYEINGNVLTLKKGADVVAKFEGEAVAPELEMPQTEEAPAGMAE